MSRPARALAVLTAAAALALIPAAPAAAHPLGNFTVNTADRVVVTADGVRVTHVVDLAEIPSVRLRQARAGLDDDGDGELSAAELSVYADQECARIAPELELEVDGERAALRVLGARAEAPPGVAGLPTTRLTCQLVAQDRPERTVSFRDPVAAERNGWREVTASSRCGSLQGSTVPQESISDLLRSYPEDLLTSPLDTTTASFTVDGDAACTADVGLLGAGVEDVAPRGLDGLTSRFTAFLARRDLTLPFALVSVAAAVLFGALHALAPGHGKTVMAAYLVGQRGTRRQALQLGALVTFTHTASVLALGAVLAVGALAAPELVVPAAEVVSGVLLVAVGLYLGVLAVRRVRAAGAAHDHDHDHEHPHPHDHEHPHDHAHPHDHEHPHDQAHPHDHEHPHDEAPGPLAVATRAVTHTHGGRAHTHAPLPEGPLSWKALVGMGVAGGLVPSPSALLVLLSATALGRPLFGVLLVACYGVGMALTLTAAGLLLLRTRAALDRRGWSGGRAAVLAQWLPLGTAGVVLVVGALLVVRGLLTGRGLV